MNPFRRIWNWHVAREEARQQRQAEALAALCKLVISIGTRLTEEDLANARRIIE